MKSHNRLLAIVLLTDAMGISTEAWHLLSDMLNSESSHEFNDDILMSVRETEGRYYLPEGWNKL